MGTCLLPLSPEHDDEMKIEKGIGKGLSCSGLRCLQSLALGKALDLSDLQWQRLSAESRRGKNPAHQFLLALLPAKINAAVIRARAGEGHVKEWRDPTLSPAGMSG